MTPADELRQAAATLRGDRDWLPEWLAVMPDDVAKPLAVMLEAFTGPADRAGWIDGLCGFPDLQAAFDFARQINGTTVKEV